MRATGSAVLRGRKQVSDERKVAGDGVGGGCPQRPAAEDSSDLDFTHVHAFKVRALAFLGGDCAYLIYAEALIIYRC